MGLDKATMVFLRDTLKKILDHSAGVNANRGLVQLQEADVLQLIDLTVDEFKKHHSSMIEISAPVTICGDTHGQFNDVIRLLDGNGWPPRTRYLFLGDYVDRGSQSVETICLMFILSIRYSRDFFILRGNHECPDINRVYGFFEECKRRFSIRVWRQFQIAFSYMPICALVSTRIFCMHGGLSPSLENFDQLRKLELPFEVPEITSLIADILWCDPEHNIAGYQPNKRGVSYIFGEDVVKAFCKKFDIDLIVRAHQVVENGFEFFADRKLVTVFSAPHYCGQFDNSAAAIVVDSTLTCKIKQLKPIRKHSEQLLL